MIILPRKMFIVVEIDPKKPKSGKDLEKAIASRPLKKTVVKLMQADSQARDASISNGSLTKITTI